MDSSTKTLLVKQRTNQILSSHINKLAAFMAKYEGYSSEEISSMLKCSESTIATYFSREWRNDYRDFADAEDQARLEIARSVLRHNMVAATKTLVRLMQCGNHQIQLAAAKEILNRTIPAGQLLMTSSGETVVETLSVKRTRRQQH